MVSAKGSFSSQQSKRQYAFSSWNKIVFSFVKKIENLDNYDGFLRW